MLMLKATGGGGTGDPLSAIRDTVYSGLSATLGTGGFVADNSNGG